MKKQKTIALLLAVLMMLSLVAACSNSAATQSQPIPTTDTTSETQSGNNADSPATPAEDTPAETPTSGTSTPTSQDPFDTLHNDSLVMNLPITNEPVTLSYMMTGLIPDMMAGVLDTYADHIQFKKAEELTGVHIDFIEVSSQTYSEKFNLMVVSGDYPDLVMNAVNSYNGGSAQALEDGFIIPLNDLAAKYAPLYMDVVNSSESLQRANVNDDGVMSQFFAVMSEYVPNEGPAARADWLDALGMEAPETFDEYHDFLVAAKNEFNPEHTLLVSTYANDLAMGMGTPGFNGDIATSHLFQKDGIVTSSFREQGYKDYIELMHQWYEEGLLNDNFYTATTEMGQSEKILLSGETALWFSSVVHLKRFVQESGIEGAAAVGLRDAVSTYGEVHHFGGDQTLVDNTKISITTACKTPEIAAQWINFWFTQEGRMMASYGTEGVSYEIGEDGVPYYTDMVLKNPDGWIYSQCTTYYCIYNNVVSLFDRRKNWGTYADYQVDALLTWRDSGDGTWELPGTNSTGMQSGLLSPTLEEYSTISTALTDISTYASETIIRFITGEKPMSEWDDSMQMIDNMGLGNVIGVYQAALDRYNARLVNQ